MVGLAAGVWSLSIHLGKVQTIAEGATGTSAINFLSGSPGVPHNVGGDPTAQAMDVVRQITGGGKAEPKSEAELVLFSGNGKMTETERARLMAEAERLRPKVPEEPKRSRR